MAVRIRLKRVGKIHYPVYRVVVVDSRKKRDGRVIEEVGQYNPNEEPSFIQVKSDRRPGSRKEREGRRGRGAKTQS